MCDLEKNVCQKQSGKHRRTVIPAQAGILKRRAYHRCWIPAFAGMTKNQFLQILGQDKSDKTQ
jgi:hypothetical protein